MEESRAIEVFEYTFQFAPIVFSWRFHPRSEKRDSCLYVSPNTHGCIKELGRNVMKLERLFFWELAVVWSNSEEFICGWCSRGTHNVLWERVNNVCDVFVH